MSFFKFGSNHQYFRSDLSQSILNNILLSERLLIEHVECLEFIVNESELQFKRNEIFRSSCTAAATATSVFGTIAILCQHYIPKDKFILKTTLTITFGSFSLLYSIKTFNRFRNRIIKKCLDDFIKSLEDFSNYIKRYIVYFNEIQIMKSMNKTAEENIDYRQTEKVWNCIRSIKLVTELLHNKTRQLEINYELPIEIADLYSPLEELQDCVYFKNDVISFNSKNIKDFYNIFAYVQSQYLFRLALLAIQNVSLNFLHNDLSFLSKRITKIIKEDEKYFMRLSQETNKSNKIEISSLNRSIPYRHNPNQQRNPNNTTSIILRDSSLKLSSCIYAVAEECQKLDNILQKITENYSTKCTENIKTNEGKNLLEIANSMRAIENSLSVCCDDFHRLILVYNKFLNDQLKLQTNENAKKFDNDQIENSEKQLNEDKHDVAGNKNEIEEKFDDFYAFANDDEENNLLKIDEKSSEVIDTNTEIFNLDEKLTKKKFKPVLKQLRNKIDPIRQEMLEKEKKILQSKGIDVNKFLNDNDNDNKLSISSDSDESYDEFERNMKKRKTKNDNYEEMRQFLAQKDTINLFQFQLPSTSSNTLEEDILE